MIHALSTPLPAALVLAATERTNVPLLVAVISVLILSLGIHEAAHAFVAWRCGDSTAKDLGRMTIDPIPHIDLVWTIVIPLMLWFFAGFMFGGAKPVPVDARRLRHPSRDMMFVALAGPLSNVLLAVFFLMVQKALLSFGGMSASQLPVRAMEWAVLLNLLLAVFNMIPVPPLDGSRVVAHLLRGSAREAYARFESMGILVVFALLYVGAFDRVILPAMFSLRSFIDTATGGPW